MSFIIAMGILCLILFSFGSWVGFQMYEGWYGMKCKKCKQRSLDWLHCHQGRETDYAGHIWCPKCGAVYYQGFEIRIFG